MKNNTVTVAKVIDDFIEEFPYGYWDGVCSCCTGFDDKEEALKEHLQKFFTTLTQHHQNQLREVYREQFELLKKSHSRVIKNCPKHPQGAPGCTFCSTNSLLKVIYGENLRELKALAQTRGIDISNRSN